MSSYAILGATGQVGGKVLQVLLNNPENELHVYVRSKSKLLKATPEVQENPKVQIFEGDLQDVELISNCLRGTKAVFMTVALTENLPGCSISMDCSRVVVEALRKIRHEQSAFKAPRLIVLSSAETSPWEQFSKDVPRFVYNSLWCANGYIYTDLAKAEHYLEQQSDWLTSVFVKPGGLVDDKARGHKLSLDRCYTFMSYADLAGAMVEVADEEANRWDMKAVSMVPETVGGRFEWKAPYVLTKGLLAWFYPDMYMYIRGWLP